MSFPATLLLSLKIVLISTGAISIAMGMVFSVPSIIAFTCHDLPLVWKSVLAFLKPPYLYFVINGIIITIAASSRFGHHHQSRNSASYQPRERLITVGTPPQSDVAAAVVLAQREEELHRNAVEAPLPLSLPPLPPVVEVYAAAEAETEAEDEDEDEKVVELKPVVVNGVQFEAAGNDDVDDPANDGWVVSETGVTPSQELDSPESALDLLSPEKEKPLTSSRFGRRKPVKTSPEGGRSLRVARPRREETLESTWKMIMEGRHVPLTRHLKRSDKWDNHGCEVEVDPLLLEDHDFTPDHVPKSKTFRDRTNLDVPAAPLASATPAPGKIGKEPSLSQDELNRRAEEFIEKFNEEMRLQRQESLNQYMEMINRGAS